MHWLRARGLLRTLRSTRWRIQRYDVVKTAVSRLVLRQVIRPSLHPGWRPRLRDGGRWRLRIVICRSVCCPKVPAHEAPPVWGSRAVARREMLLDANQIACILRAYGIRSRSVLCS